MHWPYNYSSLAINRQFCNNNVSLCRSDRCCHVWYYLIATSFVVYINQCIRTRVNVLLKETDPLMYYAPFAPGARPNPSFVVSCSLFYLFPLTGLILRTEKIRVQKEMILVACVATIIDPVYSCWRYSILVYVTIAY